MVWIVGLLAAAGSGVLGMVAHDTANSMQSDAELLRDDHATREWRDAREVAAEILKNWQTSSDPAWTDSSLASAGFVQPSDRALVASNLFKLKAADRPEDLIPRYLEQEREEALERATRDPVSGGVPQAAARTIGFMLLALVLLLPCALFWVTWVWFDARGPDGSANAA